MKRLLIPAAFIGLATAASAATGRRVDPVLRERLPAHLKRYGPVVAPVFQEAGEDLWLWLAILEQESWGGYALDPPDASGTGDGGHGRGLFQIDDRQGGWIKEFVESGRWTDPVENARAALRIMREKRAVLRPELKRLGWDEEAIYWAAVSAYNTGEGNVLRSVRAGLSPDYTTTKGPDGLGYAASVRERRERLWGAAKEVQVG